MFISKVDVQKLLLVVVLIFVTCTAGYFAKAYHFNVTDDAYISFQYAKNLVTGHGLVFNVGEKVEGYTNFLWILFLTPLYSLSQAFSLDFTSIAIFFNIIVALLNLILLFILGKRLFPDNAFLQVLTLFFCALDNSFIYYAMTGLENHLIIFWVLLTLYFGMERWLYTALILSLLCLTRPDGVLFVTSFFLAYSFQRKSWLSLLKIGGVCLLIGGVYFLWRFHYYGFLFPNTFYVKVGSTFNGAHRGFEYTQDFLSTRYYLPLFSLISIFWLREVWVRWLLIFVGLQVTYVIYIGGDFYSAHRFYTILLPVFSLLVGQFIYQFNRIFKRSSLYARLSGTETGRETLVMVSSLCVLVFFYLFTARGLERGGYQREILWYGDIVDNNVRYMKWMKTFAPTGASMVVGDIGASGFFADLKVIDVFGVVDPFIAHQKVFGFGHGKPGHEKVASREYLLSRHPTYIKWGYIQDHWPPENYYLFTEFPEDLSVPGLWVREDKKSGKFLEETNIHFEESEKIQWKIEGNAFQPFLSTQPVWNLNQQDIFGQEGSFINTYTPTLGDQATGRALSEPFLLVGDKIILRVGGGRNQEYLRVSLLVSGQRVASATGHNFEVLGRRVWDIYPYQGQEAQLEIVDEATGPWGHILVDEISQVSDVIHNTLIQGE